MDLRCQSHFTLAFLKNASHHLGFCINLRNYISNTKAVRFASALLFDFIQAIVDSCTPTLFLLFCSYLDFFAFPTFLSQNNFEMTTWFVASLSAMHTAPPIDPHSSSFMWMFVPSGLLWQERTSTLSIWKKNQSPMIVSCGLVPHLTMPLAHSQKHPLAVVEPSLLFENQIIKKHTLFWIIQQKHEKATGPTWRLVPVSRAHKTNSNLHTSICVYADPTLYEWCIYIALYCVLLYTQSALQSYGGSFLNHHQCAASMMMMRQLPQDNGASALNTHLLQVERRESHRAISLGYISWVSSCALIEPLWNSFHLGILGIVVTIPQRAPQRGSEK